MADLLTEERLQNREPYEIIDHQLVQQQYRLLESGTDADASYLVAEIRYAAGGGILPGTRPPDARKAAQSPLGRIRRHAGRGGADTRRRRRVDDSRRGSPPLPEHWRRRDADPLGVPAPDGDGRPVPVDVGTSGIGEDRGRRDAETTGDGGVPGRESGHSVSDLPPGVHPETALQTPRPRRSARRVRGGLSPRSANEGWVT